MPIVAVDMTTNRLYAANIATDSLVIVDGATNAVVGSVAVGVHPQGVAVNATTKRVYVVNQDSDDVSIVDGATGTLVESVAVGDQPRSVAVNQTTNRIYVSNVFPHSVSVIAELDASPPTITPNIVPTANAAGWHNSDVSVSWDLADPESGIASSSGCTTTTLVTNTAGTTITCTATNGAGLSSSRSVTVKIDKTAPQISYSADPDSLWPPNGKLVDVTLTVAVVDELSGPAGFELVSVVSDESDEGPGRDDPAGDIQGFTIGTADTTGQLRAERSPAGDGRVYTLMYSGRDQAGNGATCTATISVPLAAIP